MSTKEVMSVSTIVLVWSALWFGVGVMLMDAQTVVTLVKTLMG